MAWPRVRLTELRQRLVHRDPSDTLRQMNDYLGRTLDRAIYDDGLRGRDHLCVWELHRIETLPRHDGHVREALRVLEPLPLGGGQDNAQAGHDHFGVVNKHMLGNVLGSDVNVHIAAIPHVG